MIVVSFVPILVTLYLMSPQHSVRLDTNFLKLSHHMGAGLGIMLGHLLMVTFMHRF
jgi:hypothetical protein